MMDFWIKDKILIGRKKYNEYVDKFVDNMDKINEKVLQKLENPQKTGCEWKKCTC